MLNEMLSDEDDDGRSYYSKIPQHEKERNLVFMMPDVKTHRLLPLAYGYNVFPLIGTYAADVAGGVVPAEDAAWALTRAVLGAFNPLGAPEPGAEDGEDVALYLGNLYYTYNHSGTAGDFGKYNLDATFDDDFGSAGVAGGGAHALEFAPHQMASTVNQLLYIANGKYIAEYNGTTDIFTYNKLDFPTGWVVSSIKWVNNRLWMAVNKTSLTGSNKNRASLFVWDGTTDNPESEIELSGTVGGLYVKNSILYLFYQDITHTGGYKLAYVNGSQIVDLANFSGSLPAYYQISEYKDFILWHSDGNTYAWGSGDKELPIYEFQRQLRKDARWQYTNQAKEEVSDVALKVLRDFGFQG
jgi:hypothetical protein